MIRQAGWTTRIFLLLAAVLPCHRAAFPMDTGLSRTVEQLPQNLESVIFADFQDLRHSYLFKKFLKDGEFFGKQKSGIDDFKAETGINPSEDFNGLLVGFALGPEGKIDRWLFVVTGKFDLTEIKKALAGNSLQAVEHGETPIYILQKDKDKPAPGMALLSDTLITVGEVNTLKGFLDVRSGKEKGLSSMPGMMAHVKSLKQEGQVWGYIGSAPFLKRLPGQLDESISESLEKQISFVGPLKHISSFTFSAFVGKMIELQVGLIADSAEQAKDLSDALRGFVALGRLVAKDRKPEVASLLDEVEIDRGGKQIDLSLVVREEFLGRFKND